MLLARPQWLAQDVRFFNVFNHITLRTVMAAMTALLISFAAGPRVIRWLAAKKIGQAGAHRRTPDPSGQVGHADHGRRADPHRHRDHHLLWGT